MNRTIPPDGAKIGDLVLVQMPSDTGKLIRVLQALNGSGYADYEHVAIYVDNGNVIQATGGGVVVSPLSSFNGHNTFWSTAILSPTNGQRDTIVSAAHRYVGTGYSYLDYAAIAALRLGLPSAPGLKQYVASSKHMICSQLADQCYEDAGYHLFNDHRWPGYVTPADIYTMLVAVRDHKKPAAKN